MIRATFLMEQHVGHKTYYENLRGTVDADPRIVATWVPITYSAKDSWLNRLPLVPPHLRGSLIGRQQALNGIRSHVADVRFFFTQVPAMLGAEALGRAPYVLATDITPIQYDAMAEHYRHRTGGFSAMNAYKRHTNLRVFRNAAKVVPWTQWVRGSLRMDYGVPDSRMSVIPIGVDLNRWRPGPPRTPGPVRLLFVGGDFSRKGGESLLRAFRELSPGKATLDIVTKTPVPSEPGVRVHRDLQANAPELMQLFSSSDVFVLPTKADAFGIVAVEAAASGLPVLMTDVGGARDIVQDGETGYLLPPNDDRALAARLSQLVDDSGLRRRLGQASRERAEQSFDASKNGRKIVDVLLAAMEGLKSASPRVGAAHHP